MKLVTFIRTTGLRCTQYYGPHYGFCPRGDLDLIVTKGEAGREKESSCIAVLKNGITDSSINLRVENFA